jgi:cytochrome b561
MLKNNDTTYGAVAKGFHWLLFLLLTISIIFGNYLAGLPKGAEKLEAAGMHKSFGAIILTLILLRLLWRLFNVQPGDPEGTTPIQSRLASVMHWGLYLLMFAQPISGILMSQAAGVPVSFFGLFEFPVFLDKNIPLADFFRGIHGIVWILLVLAVVGHVGAALYHHYIEKDDVLKRMTVGS